MSDPVQQEVTAGEFFGAAFLATWPLLRAGCRVLRLKLSEDEIAVLAAHTGQDEFLLGFPVVKR